MSGLYIHSLLGSRNYKEGVRVTGRARAINREVLDRVGLDAELDAATSLRSRVFAALCGLLRLRARQSAFHPDAEQEVLGLGPGLFALRRTNSRTGQTLAAVHNVTGVGCHIPAARVGFPGGCRDLVAPGAGAEIELAPYQFRWLVPV